MEKRNKLWRRRHQWRLFKAKVMLMSANQYEVLAEDGTMIQHPHWMDYVNQSWCFKYKTMRTPCSCIYCKGESYNRLDYKRETKLILIEALD